MMYVCVFKRGSSAGTLCSRPSHKTLLHLHPQHPHHRSLHHVHLPRATVGVDTELLSLVEHLVKLLFRHLGRAAEREGERRRGGAREGRGERGKKEVW